MRTPLRFRLNLARTAGLVLAAGTSGAAAQAQLAEPLNVYNESSVFPLVAPGGEFGADIASAGDLNGDGITDLVVGSTTDFGPGAATTPGAIYLLTLNSARNISDAVKITDGLAGFGTPPVPLLDDTLTFGVAVDSLRDPDGDGVFELLVGSPDAGGPFGAPNPGEFWLLFYQPSLASVSGWIRYRSGDGLPDLGNTTSLGRRVAFVGDVNCDGFPDVAVSARADGQNVVYIFFLDAEFSVIDHALLTAPAGENWTGGIAPIGDLDGDSVPDIAVGVPMPTGFVRILLLDTDGSARELRRLDAGDIEFGDPPSSGSRFGADITPLPDIDGDGVDDLLVGAPSDTSIPGSIGNAYVVFLTPTRTGKGFADRIRFPDGVGTSAPSPNSAERVAAYAGATGDVRVLFTSPDPLGFGGTNEIFAGTLDFQPRLPVITRPPQSMSVAAGADAAFGAAVSGPGPYTYRWRKDGLPVEDPNISGADTKRLSISRVTAQNAGSDTVSVGNDSGDYVSEPAFLIVEQTPTAILDLNGDGLLDFLDALEYLLRLDSATAP